MVGAFFRKRKWALWAYGGGVVLLLSLYFQVHLLTLLNDWYGGFYNILQQATKHSLDEFWAAILRFASIATPYVLLVTITNYFSRLYAIRWREAITFYLIPKWQEVPLEIQVEGISQRIQEDAYRFARIVETLGIQVIRSMMLLVAFLPILWQLSKRVDAPFITGYPTLHLIESLSGETAATLYKYGEFGATTLNYVPGLLVWVALIVSVGGMVISWFVGIKLPGLEYNNQKVEAAFRKKLVLGEDELEHRGTLPLVELFTGIKFNYHRLFLHYGYFDIWANIFYRVMEVVPYLIAAPALFSGMIMLGVLVQISNAFDKVQQSMSLFIDNWTTVTELRSIWKRLHETIAKLKEYEVPSPSR
ncbi:MAG: putative transporter [Candidatus Niyogibacteria bacterium]|nr:putative transporter [Candidatus Niyogibacteria bacterium]